MNRNRTRTFITLALALALVTLTTFATVPVYADDNTPTTATQPYDIATFRAVVVVRTINIIRGGEVVEIVGDHHTYLATGNVAHEVADTVQAGNVLEIRGTVETVSGSLALLVTTFKQGNVL